MITAMSRSLPVRYRRTADMVMCLLVIPRPGSRPTYFVPLRKRTLGIVCIGLTGSRGGPMRELCHHLLEVPAADAPKIQEGHLVLGHILCGLIENAIFGNRV